MTIINIQMASEIPDTFKATFCYLLSKWGHHMGNRFRGGAWRFQAPILTQRIGESGAIEPARSLPFLVVDSMFSMISFVERSLVLVRVILLSFGPIDFRPIKETMSRMSWWHLVQALTSPHGVGTDTRIRVCIDLVSAGEFSHTTQIGLGSRSKSCVFIIKHSPFLFGPMLC
jgi:hypothetical protein